MARSSAARSAPVEQAPVAAAPEIDTLLLSEVYEGTDGAQTFAFVSPADIGPLVSAGYAVANAGTTDGQGNVAARITDAGRQYLKENAPDLVPQSQLTVNQEEQMNTQTSDVSATQEASRRARAQISGIVSGLNLTAVGRRGGTRTESYPFSQLEVGQGFFIPATEEVPKPATAYASTVNSATTRYAKEIPGKTRVNRKGVEVPELEYTRIFKIVSMADGAPFGPEFAGKPGAGVQRVQ